MQVDHHRASENTPLSQDAEIVIVGGGPVGLLTGVLLKILNAEVKVVVLEKYEEYKRDNPLRLDRRSFDGYPENEKIQSIISVIFRNGAKTAKVNTKEIEQMLENTAKDLKIDIRKGEEVTDLKQLQERYSSAKVIVGADGAHSTIRERIFGGNFKEYDIQYIAQVKYETENTAPKPIPPLKRLRKFGFNRVVVTEITKPAQDDGEQKGNVSLLIGISRKNFESLKDAKFNSPYALEKCPSSVQKKVRRWMNFRSKKDGEVDLTSIKVSSIKLNAYRSQDFIKEKDGVTYGLVGDAAFGVPYFRSLNNGIMCANQLAKAVHEAHQNTGKAQEPYQKYNTFVDRLSKKEMFSARLKGLAIRALNFYMSIVGWIPSKAMDAYEQYIKDQYKAYGENNS